MRRAFVSHSTADDSYVAEMESLLRAAGFDEVFNDDSAIRPDEQFWPAIEKGIEDCDTLVVVISSASMTSEWVKREVEYARGLSKNIIPLRIDDCSIPPIFDGRRVIDFRPPSRQERRFDISRIVKYAPAELIGRDDETKLLAEAWGRVLRAERGRPHVLTFVALGGEGKTSLIAKWAVDEMRAKDWPGCDAVFAWSFYRQGTSEQMAASSDLFLKEALTFFGDETDKQFAASNAGAYEKGQRLARIVGQRRSLLILDGLEPLQYTPTSPTPGQLKDQGIAALLRALATASHGLCVVTTRYSLPDLKAFWQTAAPEVKLLQLSRAAGVHLLKTLGVRGSELRNIPLKDGGEKSEMVNEFEKLVEDVKGHALTLNLLGTYLRDAHVGDIRKRDLVKLEKAVDEQGGHAFRVMEAYEREFEREGDKGHRALAVLRLLGLFDRPLTSDCLGAVLRPPAIPRLTEPLVGLTEAQRNLAFKRLEDARLVTVNRDESGALDTLDAHPLLREYFSRQLRAHQPDAWRATHRRLYEHLCATAPKSTEVGWCDRLMHILGLGMKKAEPTLEDLDPLYRAVAHGCQAGLQRQALRELGFWRIQRGTEEYPIRKLGAFGSSIGALACFFDEPWTDISSSLKDAHKAWVLTSAAICLRAVGRLNEADDPMRKGLDMWCRLGNRKQAAIAAYHLSDLELSKGNLAEAVEAAELSVEYADQSGDAFLRCCLRGSYADALHQKGHREEAKKLFRKAHDIEPKRQVGTRLKYWIRGFQYYEFLLAEAERGAWEDLLRGDAPCVSGQCDQPGRAALESCRNDARKTLTFAEENHQLLDIALDRLALGRADLYEAIFLSPRSVFEPGRELEGAVSGLRLAGQPTIVPLALLTRAWLRFLSGVRTGPESAQADLDEAWEIAERGPMNLLLADIHLHRARLFFREAQYPWESPQADLAAAEKLINECGYHRRDEELADAKRAILG
jgi:tetratricopeptide (TPR) repeat protein